MLEAKEVHGIDIGDYKGASIVCDLCEPLPDKLANSADFIVGASTLDDVFDPAQYLRNIAKLLRPGERLFEINHLNNHMRPGAGALLANACYGNRSWPPQ
jgi:SAM-dependent methyltransferase